MSGDNLRTQIVLEKKGFWTLSMRKTFDVKNYPLQISHKYVFFIRFW
jgi:hypothetical protein